MPTREEVGKTRFPYMPFYVDDWLSSDTVEGFTLEQQGAYMLLLCRQWKAPDGRLPKDELVLARWSRLGTRWRSVGRPIVNACFVERQGGLVNLRLRRLWEEIKDKSKKAKAAAEKRWSDERDNGNGDDE